MSEMQKKMFEYEQFLLPHGFYVVDQHESKSFGNYYIVFDSPHFKLRIIQDRDQESIELSPKTYDDWIPLNFVIAIVKNSDNLQAKNDVSQLKSLIKEELETLNQSFSSQKFFLFKEKISKLKKERKSQLFPNLRKSNS